MSNLLLITLLVPFVGIALVWGDSVRSRQVALATSLVVLALAGVLVFSYPPGATKFAVKDIAWLSAAGAPIDVRLSVGLDGLSLWLFGLTALLSVVAVLISWDAITDHATGYYRLLLLLEGGMLGVFIARDIILFYIFFEFTLIPLFLLIGVWGSEQRQQAALKFFLYTLTGSLLTFLGLLAIVLASGGAGCPSSLLTTFSIPDLTAHLTAHPLTPAVQMWIFLALFAGFAIKVPLFPLHTWLPLAHVQAPAAGSVILAGLLLKIGAYGFLRFCLPLLPAATALFMPWILWLALAGILYGALVALAQHDMKRLIAYSSVSHLGFCMLGIFALNRLSVQGSALQMINHGLSTGALFALVGMLYERYHTRQIADLGGLAREVPVLTFFFVFMTLSSIGLPGLNNFAGEFLLLLGMFERAWTDILPARAGQMQVIAVLATLGIVLGAWYMLWLVQRVFFGPVVRTPHQSPVHDLKLREIAALTSIAVFILWIGLQPSFFLNRMAPTLDRLTNPSVKAVAGTEACPTVLFTDHCPLTTDLRTRP